MWQQIQEEKTFKCLKITAIRIRGFVYLVFSHMNS